MTTCNAPRFLACFAAAVSLAAWSPVQAQTSSPLRRYSPPFKAAELFALAKDGLLIWTPEGQAQIRDSQGEWSPTFQLPMSRVLQVAARGQGFLVLGVPKPGRSDKTFPVVAYDNAGRQGDQWNSEPAWTLAAADTSSWVITEPGTLVPLLPGGNFSAPQAIPLWHDQPPRDPDFATTPLRWHRFGWHDVAVYCHDADLTKQSRALARCHRAGPAGWVRQLGDQLSGKPVTACGRWLMTLEGKQARQLTVIDMTNGQVSSSREIAREAAIRCAGDDELVLGHGRRLELLGLPGLESRWQSQRLPGKVLAVAATENYLAYRVSSGFDILSIPRPRRGRHP